MVWCERQNCLGDLPDLWPILPCRRVGREYPEDDTPYGG